VIPTSPPPSFFCTCNSPYSLHYKSARIRSCTNSLQRNIGESAPAINVSLVVVVVVVDLESCRAHSPSPHSFPTTDTRVQALENGLAQPPTRIRPAKKNISNRVATLLSWVTTALDQSPSSTTFVTLTVAPDSSTRITGIPIATTASTIVPAFREG